MSAEEIRAWVNKLNDMAPDEIRDLFVSEGIQGARNNSAVCPVATFLKRKVPDQVVRVACSVTLCWPPGMYPSDDEDVAMDRHPHSDSLTEFITRVDRRQYPELIVSSGPRQLDYAP